MEAAIRQEQQAKERLENLQNEHREQQERLKRNADAVEEKMYRAASRVDAAAKNLEDAPKKLAKAEAYYARMRNEHEEALQKLRDLPSPPSKREEGNPRPKKRFRPSTSSCKSEVIDLITPPSSDDDYDGGDFDDDHHGAFPFPDLVPAGGAGGY
jgi:chromosome segregation ATPase